MSPKLCMLIIRTAAALARTIVTIKASPVRREGFTSLMK